MKSVCDNCKHQELNIDKHLHCTKAIYEIIDGKMFKRGCNCIHDINLHDRFEAILTVDKTDKWQWRMDYCKSNQLSPSDGYNWIKSNIAYDKYLNGEI